MKLIIARLQKYLFLPGRYLYSFLKDYSLERSILFSCAHLKETWHYIKVMVVACKNLKPKQVAGAAPFVKLEQSTLFIEATRKEIF